MEFRTMDLTILSANDLKYVNHFRKMDVYVVVSVNDLSFNLNSTISKQKTPVHKKGDKSPTWNYPISFTLSDVALQQNRVTVVFQIYSKRFFPVDKLIGEVHVPVSDLLAGGGADRKEARTLSYEVKKSGKPRGVLNFTCKFGEKYERAGPTPFDRGPATAYPYQPAPQQQQPPPPMWGQPVPGYPPPPPMQAGYGYPYQGQGSRFGNGYGGGQRMGGGMMGGGRNNMGLGLGAGLLGGALGGMLIGDMMSDAAYDGGGYDGGFDGGFDGGGFDF